MWSWPIPTSPSTLISMPLLNAHMESGADVTIAYKKEKLPESARKSDVVKDLYYTLGLEGSKVRKIYMNSQEEGIQNFSMNIYVMERERLINEINTAFVRGYTYFERDILAHQLGKMKVRPMLRRLCRPDQ